MDLYKYNGNLFTPLLTSGKLYSGRTLDSGHIQVTNDNGWLGTYDAAGFELQATGRPGSFKLDIVPREQDPTGRDQHAPGAKVDAGKVRVALVIRGFARALWKVSEVGTFGAAKYTENGWTEVPNGEARYADAQMRHFLKEAMGEQVDPDSNIEHLAHEAWNALAKLDLVLRRKEKEQA